MIALRSLAVTALLLAWYASFCVAGLATYATGGWSQGFEKSDGTCGGMSYGEWLKFTPVEDKRGFWTRLWASRSWSFALGMKRDADTGALKAEVTKAQLSMGAPF